MNKQKMFCAGSLGEHRRHYSRDKVELQKHSRFYSQKYLSQEERK